MSDDPIAVLERELVDAARRRAGPRAPAGRATSTPLAGRLATAVAVATVLAIAAGAVILLGGHRRPPASPAAPGKQQLLAILGVLRRPQTTADLHSPEIDRFLRYRAPFVAQGPPDVSLIRRAAVTPWGSGVFLIPEKPASTASLAALRRRFASAPAAFLDHLAGTAERVALEVDNGGSCCATAADIEAGDDMTVDGAGRSFAGGSSATRLVLVVPDGVAEVDFFLPRQPAPWDSAAPIYRRALMVAVAVHGNIAAVQVGRESKGAGTAMIWKAADGRVIKRIGSPAAAARVIAPPRPAPETPLSRAAERSPSTPNPVWVAPSIGGPQAHFTVHFRLLLNGADYRFTYSGTRCPRVTLSGGGGGGTGDLRGKIWSDALDAVQGQTWCPGTYQVAVAVGDLGRRGALKQPAKPFGRATFTVRP